MREFDHFILTRFNYPDENELFLRRLQIFCKNTLRSIERQTDQRFTWIIRTKHEAVREVVSHLNNVICQGDWTINCESGWVVTTRLDNDDIVSPYFVGRVQSRFDQREKLVDFRGYRLNATSSECVKFDYYKPPRLSPFVSLIEPTGNAQHVMHATHGDIGNHHDVDSVDARLWCQVIHDCNYSMSWKTGFPQCRKPEWIT